MKTIHFIFGEGDKLSIFQMSCRSIVVFLFTLILLRIAGRRSFGLKAPFDNIILILLGAILGRAVVGASPFIPTLAASLVISFLHRIFALLGLKFPLLNKLIKGEKYSLFSNGSFNPKNMKRSLVTEEDVMEEVRLRALIPSLDQVDVIFMERNGNISTVKKP